MIERMFDLGSAAAPAVDDVRGAVLALTRIGAGSDDVDRIDLLDALEEHKGAAEGAQAVLAAAFDRSRHEAEAAAGVPEQRQGRGVAAQVGLARRESPHRARQHVGMALVLRDQMPCTRRALRLGRIGEWRAMLLVRETACLSRELAYELDHEAFVERRARAEADRRVTARPMPEVMSQVTALLPVRAGVAVWAVLSREADRAKASGDERSRGQIMADTLVSRVLSPGCSRPAAMRPGAMRPGRGGRG
jgi:hypothetical protein